MNINSNLIEKRYPGLFSLAASDQKLYLVGGVVRDLVLGRENKDIDILCEHDSIVVARKWALLNHGAFYVLDEERGTSRVILNAAGVKSIFDFARQQGKSLEEDLSARDFTINSMAIDFSDPDVVIDPMHGIDDLQKRILRACSTSSFTMDPVRVIRAFRYASAYNLTIDVESNLLLIKSVLFLQIVSNERKRDEIFKILDLENPIQALKQLDGIGILNHLGLPSTSAKEFSLFASLLRWLDLIQKNILDSNPDIDFFNYLIAKYCKQYAASLNQRNASDRNLRQLLLLSTLIAGLNETEITPFSQKLCLASEETQRLIKLKRFHTNTENLLSRTEPITDREIYIFFNQVGIAGLDLCWLAIAGQSDQQQQKRYIHQAGRIFESWFDRPQVAKPTPILNGNELMIHFDLTPGPIIGKLIDKLKEEQAAGTITNQQQALDWVEAQVSTLQNERYWEKGDLAKQNH